MPTAVELAVTRLNLCLGAERQLLAQNCPKRRLPVTIVTGFLGAGKTSLLQYILQYKLNLRIACAISDLAAINIDALLVTNEFNDNSNKVFALKADPDTSVDTFKDAVWQILNEDDDDAAAPLDHVDYLVMETSGTMDPTQLVAAVQEKFGKMTRARLDSVVTVVDGDVVAQDAAKEIKPCAVAVRQLQCADVVLLNKVDLLDEKKLKIARQIIKQYAPNARVYDTVHSQVYLPHVLDIALPEEAFSGGVSHEKVQAQWKTGILENGAVSPAPSRLRVKQGQVAEPNASATPSQSFASVAFESTTPTPLSAVHDWVQHHLPEGTLRAKGVLYIAELPIYRFVVQLSGKRRLEVENAGVWKSLPKTQFVVIGLNSTSNSGEEPFDEVKAYNSLATCFAKSTDQLTVEDKSIRDEIQTKLEANEFFEMLIFSEQSTMVAFRLMCPTSRLDETMLHHHHHVDTNELTKQLVQDVNASGGGSLLLYACNLSLTDNEEEQVYAVASNIGAASVLTMWNELNSCAEQIINECHMLHTHNIMCSQSHD
ncbi:unnamed protein product [Peronospora belbahrii]|uniref:CobW C-terminal domain-containing protein n=1 Tax=Peronospora belbahrii TaxID=622444 RepID=A0AAU9KJQ6_9STRA|nr:unnamed protein product [Peronospora belbahrii]CAH0516257.1 unnamed protein product [Peronospora belbahrii]